MSHTNTIPRIFAGTPTLTPDKVVTLKSWYVGALGDFDVSTMPEDASYYLGASRMVEGVLSLLYENIPTEVVEVVKQNKHMSFKKKVFIGTMLYIVIDGRLIKRAKVALDKKFPLETPTY